MTHRSLVSTGKLAALMAVLAWVATVPVAGQGPSAAKANGSAAKAYTAARTPDGQPDLSGYWTNASYTPLQRPKNVTKEFYTPAELDELAAAERKAAALAWNAFEGIASHLVCDPKPPEDQDIEREIALARIEAHYFMNESFLETDDQLLRDAWRLRSFRGVIVQGRYDLVCPMQSAWELAAAWPEARLVVVPAAGHAADEPGVASALVEATEAFKASAR